MTDPGLSQPQPTVPERAGPPEGFWLELRSNLAAGLRAAVFRRVRLSDLRPSPGQIVVLVLLGLAVQVLFELLRVGVQGEFNFQGLPRALVYVPLLLLSAFVIARRERVPALLVAVPVLFCAVGLPYDMAFEALDYAMFGVELGLGGWLGLGGYDRAGEGLWYGLYALWLAAMILGIARITQASLPRAVRHAAVFGIFVALPLWYLPPDSLWEARENAASASRDWDALRREDAFYRQQVLLDRAVNALRPERKGVEDLYFVGLAGDASEDVFMKEMAVVGELFRRRFDADGRIVTLVNNPGTVGELPLASATGLNRALKDVGRIMNPDEDVLFLYITSHGSEDHRLNMQFWPLQLNDIDPDMLRRMLDESGIKWRVIAISACYSGGFIERLKDERSVILTASDASNPSFGCGNASDFTYFAKAYFDEALRGTYSFVAAFDQARARIAAREKAEARTSSNPQIHVGSAAEAKLRRLSERLERLDSRLQVQAPQPAPADARSPRACRDCN